MVIRRETDVEQNQKKWGRRLTFLRLMFFVMVVMFVPVALSVVHSSLCSGVVPAVSYKLKLLKMIKPVTMVHVGEDAWMWRFYELCNICAFFLSLFLQWNMLIEKCQGWTILIYYKHILVYVISLQKLKI